MTTPPSDRGRGDTAPVTQSTPPPPAAAQPPAAAHDGGQLAAVTVREQVRQLRERTDRTARLHAELAAVVSEQLAPGLADLREQVGEQQHQLRRVADWLAEEQRAEARVAPVGWPGLDPGRAETEWALLADWITEVLVGWYEVTRDELPDCWALHRPAVMELSWLRLAYLDTEREHVPRWVTGDWHWRSRPIVMNRLREVIPTRLCRPGVHLLPADGPPLDAPGTLSAGASAPRGAREPGAGRQLAGPQWWWEFYERAVRDDVAWRQARKAGTVVGMTPRFAPVLGESAGKDQGCGAADGHSNQPSRPESAVKPATPRRDPPGLPVL